MGTFVTHRKSRKLFLMLLTMLDYNKGGLRGLFCLLEWFLEFARCFIDFLNNPYYEPLLVVHDTLGYMLECSPLEIVTVYYNLL